MMFLEVVKMVKYLLASHGEFSKGTESFLKIMIGTNTSLYTLVAFLDDTSIESLVKNKLEEIGDFDQLIVFCDLYGGSVAQEVFRQTKLLEKNIQIIAGYNLALVMDIIFKNKILENKEIKSSIEESKSAIVYLNDLSATNDSNDLF